MVNEPENMDPEDKKEDSFEFDSAGETVGYISMPQARVLAMRTAREEPGNYGVDFAGIQMVFEVASSEQDSEEEGGLFHVRLSYRPEGNFQGQPGIEEFIFTDVGEMEIRQVLSWPVGASGPTAPAYAPTPALIADTVTAENSTGESAPSSPSNIIRVAQQKIHPSIEILTPGEICTIAGNGKRGDSGDGGMAVNANLDEPYDIAVDELGNIYIADSGNNKIRKVSVDTGIIETEVGTGTAGFAGDGDDPRQAQLNRPRGIDFDSLGNLYIADRENYRVRRVDSSSGLIETIAGNGVSGNGGDEQPAQLGQLCHPESVSVDRATGRVYITGKNGFSERDRKRVRVVDEGGVLRTFAGSEDGPKPQDGAYANNVRFSTEDDLVIAVDSNGNVFIGEQNGNRLYMVSCETGVIKTICGNGSAAYALLSKPPWDFLGGSFGGDGLALDNTIEPQGLAFYAADNVVFINDGGSVFRGNKRIRKLDLKSGIISSVAGTRHVFFGGKAGFRGDGGPATLARFKNPRGLAVDSYGNLYIADTGNNRIRVVRKS